MFEKIAKYLADQLDIAVEDIKPETTFESLGIDSLDTVEMVMDLEEELGVELDAPNGSYVGVTVENVTVGYGKYSGGRLKNHYPKGLRNKK